MRFLKLKIFVLVSLFSATAFADVPPPSGKTYVTESLNITADVNTEPYRFFLVSPIDAKEIELKQGKPVDIDGSGRGGAAKFTKLVAVPKDSLKEFEGKSPNEIAKALNSKSVPGMVELFSHSFQKEVPSSDEGKKSTAVYIIEQMRSGELTATRDLEAETNPSAKPKSGAGSKPEAGSKNVSFGLSDIIWAYPVVTYALIAIGLLAALAVGVLIFRSARGGKSAS